MRISKMLFGRRISGWVVAGVLTGVLIPAIIVANDLFSDVPTASPFHNDINAIALAGITTGCGPGIYCPNDFVTRGAMAAFMHRGFSRVTKASWSATVTQTTDGAAAVLATDSLTVAFPAGSLPGTTGFLEGHASVNITASATGCPCQYWAALYDNTTGTYFDNFYSLVTLANGVQGHVSVSGVVPTTITGAHTLQVRVFQPTGTVGGTAFGDATFSYHPFGASGTNTAMPSIAYSGPYATPQVGAN